MSTAPTVTTLFHGPDGARLTSALQGAGVQMQAMDPLARSNPQDALAAAVAGADVVLSLNSPAQAPVVAAAVAGLLPPGAVFADLNGAAPAAKAAMAQLFPHGAFADVAWHAPAGDPASGLALEVSGTGARQLIDVLAPAGISMAWVSDVPGAAAARAMVRSLLAKSLATAVIDTLWVAEGMGLAQWAHAEVLETFEHASAQSLQESLADTAKNFKRRQMELVDVLEALRGTGFESSMAAPIDYTYGSLMHGKKIPFTRLP